MKPLPHSKGRYANGQINWEEVRAAYQGRGIKSKRGIAEEFRVSYSELILRSREEDWDGKSLMKAVANKVGKEAISKIVDLHLKWRDRVLSDSDKDLKRIDDFWHLWETKKISLNPSELLALVRARVMVFEAQAAALQLNRKPNDGKPQSEPPRSFEDTVSKQMEELRKLHLERKVIDLTPDQVVQKYLEGDVVPDAAVGKEGK